MKFYKVIHFVLKASFRSNFLKLPLQAGEGANSILHTCVLIRISVKKIDIQKVLAPEY